MRPGPTRKPNRNRLAPQYAQRLQALQESSTEIVRDGVAPREPAASLQHVAEESMNRMSPGDILLLDSAESFRDLVDPAFYAILACPICGKLDLITQAQYSGIGSVICDYDDCSCHFRIGQRHALIYMPVN
ncbi:MAG TPA: hypothetical protein VKV79_05240 [Terriglobia bacterium]|nr:hypothetical protein [Terriglobia bacterium]